MTGKLELDSNGNIKLFPLVKYETHLAAGMFAILRLGFATSEEEFESGNLQNLQLAVTPVQCRALAQTLLQAEQALLSQSSSPRGS